MLQTREKQLLATTWATTLAPGALATGLLTPLYLSEFDTDYLSSVLWIGGVVVSGIATVWLAILALRAAFRYADDPDPAERVALKLTLAWLAGGVWSFLSVWFIGLFLCYVLFVALIALLAIASLRIGQRCCRRYGATA